MCIMVDGAPTFYFKMAWEDRYIAASKNRHRTFPVSAKKGEEHLQILVGQCLSRQAIKSLLAHKAIYSCVPCSA